MTATKPVRLMRPHPAALLMPTMSDAEFEALCDDIAEHGVLQPVVTYQGQILDGRHRIRACDLLGIDPPSIEYTGDDPAGFVISTNIVRRHLSAEQKRAAIEALLKLDPSRSDRSIAALTRVSHHTVASVRAELVDGGQIAHHEQRVGADGVAQPATKPPRAPEPVAEPPARPAEHSTPSTSATDAAPGPRRVAAAPAARRDAAPALSPDDERAVTAAAKAVIATVEDELERLPRRLQPAFQARLIACLREPLI